MLMKDKIHGIPRNASPNVLSKSAIGSIKQLKLVSNVVIMREHKTIKRNVKQTIAANYNNF